MNNFHVITGGPGSGKTSLINELNNNGFLTVPEEGRRIIKEQIEFSGEGLPWKNKAAFATLMLDASLESYHKMIQEAAGSFGIFRQRNTGYHWLYGTGKHSCLSGN